VTSVSFVKVRERRESRADTRLASTEQKGTAKGKKTWATLPGRVSGGGGRNIPGKGRKSLFTGASYVSGEKEATLRSSLESVLAWSSEKEKNQAREALGSNSRKEGEDGPRSGRTKQKRRKRDMRVLMRAGRRDDNEGKQLKGTGKPRSVQPKS